MTMWRLTVVALLCVTAVTGDDSSGSDSVSTDEEVTALPPSWSFNAPEQWQESYESCSSDNLRQSPIDVPVGQTIFDDGLQKVAFRERINRMHTTSTIKNKGYTVSLDVPHQAYVGTGVLPIDGFRLAGVKFSWGGVATQGSEHKLSGKTYPLEAQIYAYDETKYDDVKAAIDGTDSLAVFSVFFELSEEDNPTLQKIVKRLKRIAEPGSTTLVPHVPLSSLLPANVKQYYRYQGSVPLPPCSENVIYTVFNSVNTISAAQLEQFLLLKANPSEAGVQEVLKDNFRPVQPVGERIVYRSFLFRNEMSRPEQVYVKEAESGSAALLPSTLLATLAIVMGKLIA